MARTIKSSTTKHTNGATSTRHRVVIQHSGVPDLDEKRLSLDAVMRRSHPPEPRRPGGGAKPRAIQQPAQRRR